MGEAPIKGSDAGREARDFLETTYRASPLRVFVVAGGRLLYANQALLEGAGTTALALEETGILGVVLPEDRERVRFWLEEEREEVKRDTPLLFRLQSDDRGPLWVAGTATVFPFGPRTALLVHLMDIGGLKTAEEEARSKAQELDQIFLSLSSLFLAVSLDGRVLKVNGIAERTFNVSRESLLGNSLWGSGLPWQEAAVEKALEECVRYQAPVRIEELRYTRQDGKDGFLDLTLNPVKIGTREESAVLIVGSEITEHKFLQLQLFQAQKLESVGQLAAGIAHEINTPTQYIGDNLRFLQDTFGEIMTLLRAYRDRLSRCTCRTETDPAAEALRALEQTTDLSYLEAEIPLAITQAKEGIGKVTQIVHSMRVFCHPGSDRKTLFDVRQAIEGTVTVSRNAWKYVADMALDIAADLPMLLGYPQEFNQVILNLIMNAVHAIEDVMGRDVDRKGRIDIEARRKGERIEVKVRDSGCGIPPGIRARVFDPFFTTKEVGRGTGQGLAICHSVIVEHHEGTITFESEQGKGTVFTIQIPIKESTPPENG